jgi:hypothetical protein
MPTSSIPASGGGGLQPKYQKFTSSGTFTLPDGYGAAKPLLVNIQVIGGGGGGTSNTIQATGGTAFFNLGFNNYFGANGNVAFTPNTTLTASAANVDGKGGGSGGIAQTQFYLTSNLTITVGAAGAAGATVASNGNRALNSSDNQQWRNTNGSRAIDIQTTAAGSGGTTTAGSVSAAGGTGARISNATVAYTYTNSNYNDNNTNNATIVINALNAVNAINAGTVGAGGTPSGTAGDATPLLGTLAGGSGSTTAVFGSFGVGGKRGDAGTNTGVEGTGGGAGAIGAPGAVILTWWQ